MAAATLPRSSPLSLIGSAAIAAAVSEADADVQDVVNLVNRFVISTVQFLNRFSDECESRLVETAEALQQVELQTQLLEHLLVSSGAADPDVDEEDDDDSSRSVEVDSGILYFEDGENATLKDDGSYTSEAHSGRRRRGQFRGALGRAGDVGDPRGLPPPPLPINGRSGQSPPLPGNYRKGPPRPPPGAARAAVAAQAAEAARAATLAIVGAPVPMPQLSGEAPAPPPPLELRPGRLLMRCHPRLRGYFELVALRVPLDLVKAKMQVEGFPGEWLDTPDLPAPGTLPAAVRSFVDEPDD